MKKIIFGLMGLALALTITVGAFAGDCCDGPQCCSKTCCAKTNRK